MLVRWCLLGSLLASVGDSSSVGQLIPVLREPAERSVALRRLASLGPTAREAVPEVEKLVAQGDSGTRVLAAQTLWYLDSGNAFGLPLLARWIQRDEGVDREAAAQAVGQIGPPAAAATEALISALGAQDERLRATSAWALGRIGPAASAAAPKLAALMRSDPSPQVRDDARWARYRVQREGSIKELVKLVGEDRDAERQMAVQILGEKGPAAAEAIPALVDVLRHRSSRPSNGGVSDGEGFARVRLTAAWALGEIATTEVIAVETLRKVAADSAEATAIRDEATKALKKIEGRRQSG
jgi:HEAT repeat protein